MKRIIALPYLAAELAEKNNMSADLAERYLHALVELVSEALSHGEQVRIKGLGIFAVASGGVTFTPEQPLADSVNAPFAAFEPVVLAEGVELDEPEPGEVVEKPEEPHGDDVEATEVAEEVEVPMEDEVVPPPYLIPKEEDEIIEALIPVEPDEPSADEAPKEEDEIVTRLVPKEEDEIIEEMLPKVPVETQEPTAEEAPVEQDESPVEEPPVEPEESPAEEAPVEQDESPAEEAPEEPVYYDNEIPERQYPWVWTIIGLVCGIIIGFAAGYFLQPKVDEWIAGGTVEVTEPQPAPADSLAEAVVADTVAPVPAPVAEPVKEAAVYDTIRSTRFLTTMARQHYGQMEYWVYIYEANADILGHPDRAKAGTVVRIPDIKKFLTSESDSVNIARARAKAVEIYKPYRQ